MDLKTLCQSVVELAKNTGQYIRDESQNSKQIKTKGKNDFVTHVDKGAEERIVARLSELLPEAGFIAEEGSSTKVGDRYNWIIDPIDGTTNFIHGLFPHAISIALQDNDIKSKEIVLGVVYELGLNECFYSWKDAPAYLNGEVITVSQAPKIADSLLATGFPYANFERMEGFMKSLDYFMKNSHGLRRLGSAAVDLAYVACGRFEGFYEYGLQSYDVAAGAFLVQQAGGHNCDFSGGKNYLYGQEIISSNALIFKEFKKVIYNLMYGESE
ncbi:myo-inositol-1(or 4)-monophosphatase [Saccharicrinis carchari]|uniref:Inositol-1-monophosphatase n=1 Tax=Saccharicrinis carchari TaxID=1168039 RepID=A0A521F1Z2_SACCC|nr:inositol monophosphatase family protein [Saccharicrinis carchari]SMO90086.1 myo-inositol-1(or 4)-monophosphatase [Saccharicrinis carchari]